MSEALFGPSNRSTTATIPSGGPTASGVIDLLHYRHLGFIFPAMTSTAVTFTVCDTRDGTFVALTDADGAAVSLAVTSAARAVGLHEDERDALAPWRFVKLVPGSAEAAARSVVIVMKA